MSVISNTTVLVNFALIGQVDLLRAVFGTLYIAHEVYAELEDGAREGYTVLDSLLEYISPPAEHGWPYQTGLASIDELRQLSTMPGGLHRGEAACLAIAMHRGWLFLSDDRAARAEACRRRIAVSGSLGCLVLTVERHILPLAEANRLLAAMIAHGYYAPIQDLTPLLHP